MLLTSLLALAAVEPKREQLTQEECAILFIVARDGLGIARPDWRGSFTFGDDDLPCRWAKAVERRAKRTKMFMPIYDLQRPRLYRGVMYVNYVVTDSIEPVTFDLMTCKFNRTEPGWTLQSCGPLDYSPPRSAAKLQN